MTEKVNTLCIDKRGHRIQSGGGRTGRAWMGADACLENEQRQHLTNSTLRERFGISKENSAMVSRIIKEAFEEGVIKLLDPANVSKKYVRYVPFWA